MSCDCGKSDTTDWLLLIGALLLAAYYHREKEKEPEPVTE